MAVTEVKVYKGGASDNDCAVEVWSDGKTRQVAKLGYVDQNGERVVSYEYGYPISFPHNLMEHNVRTGSAGTPVQITSGNAQSGTISIRALPTNTGIVVIGSFGVSAASLNGAYLYRTESFTTFLVNLADLYFDITQAGDGISYFCTFAKQIP